MSESLFSPLWYRVTDLRPQLRHHVEMHRHDYRGLIWYILEDKASGRSHRFNATAYQVIGLLDGELTVNQIWNLVNDRMGDLAPTQDQIIQLLGQLHSGDLLQAGLPVDTDELLLRSKQHKTNKFKQRFSNPLTIKVPLWDPDGFLERHLSKVSWLFSWLTGAIWMLIVLLGALLTVINWPQITGNFVDNSLSPYNLIIMAVLYPVIKFLHELGHAFSAKYHGGEVHEMGITFLMFMPIPYVDVSAVNFLRSKHQRILVSAAGIIVELFIAALGLFIWLSAEPSLIKDIAFNAMVIGGISSLLFNGNPLLKYDGYYILADLLEIPNLFQRSSKYLIYLCQKYLFGINDRPSPATAAGESGWFVIYSISSFVYRMGLLWLIITYITDTFFVLGVLLACWMVWQQLLFPLMKGILFIFTSPLIHRKRARSISSVMAILATFSLILMVPISSYTVSEGIVWMPEDAQLRAESNGIAGPILTTVSAGVDKETEVIEIYDSELDTEVTVLFAKLRELNTKFRSEMDNDQVKAAKIKEEMIALALELKLAKKNQQAMVVRAPKSGRLLIPDADDLPGKFIRRGDVIGYVVDESLPTVRVVVSQSDIGQVQKLVEEIEVRLVNQPNVIHSATIKRRIPEASNSLPSAALASTNGGKIKIDTNDSEGLTTKEKVFHIDLEYTPQTITPEIGQRVYVRFKHGSEPIGQQWYRNLRQVFLRQFNV
ncbi:MAG: site-2 protease family protein [Methylophagaceae bacterium]